MSAQLTLILRFTNKNAVIRFSCVKIIETPGVFIEIDNTFDWSK